MKKINSHSLNTSKQLKLKLWSTDEFGKWQHYSQNSNTLFNVLGWANR